MFEMNENKKSIENFHYFHTPICVWFGSKFSRVSERQSNGIWFAMYCVVVHFFTVEIFDGLFVFVDVTTPKTNFDLLHGFRFIYYYVRKMLCVSAFELAPECFCRNLTKFLLKRKIIC